jgi:lysophospholipid acyltransferase 1/2
LSLVHIHRLIFDYGNYTLDISGPLMINTQKLTALAFAFYDGYRSKERRRSSDDKEFSTLNKDQEKQKIVGIPNPLEYFSYIFYFHGICVGPLCFYKDYRDFIDGRNLLVIPTSTTKELPKDDQFVIEQPSTFWPVCTKLAQCVIWCYILLIYTPFYTVEYNLSKEMVQSPVLKRLSYLLFSTFCVRAK